MFSQNLSADSLFLSIWLETLTKICNNWVFHEGAEIQKYFLVDLELHFWEIGHNRFTFLFRWHLTDYAKNVERVSFHEGTKHLKTLFGRFGAVWTRFPTALNSYSIFMWKGGKSRKSNFGNEKLFRMSSYTCEDFQDEIPDILSHDQKHHFHFGRKKQDVWESFFLVGPIFNQKRPFLFEVDFFLVRLIFDEKRPFFLVRVFFNEKWLFYLLTFFLGETYP